MGDPLVDIGWLLASWAEPEDSDQWIVEPPTVVPGFGSRAELLGRLEDASALDLVDVDYYVAFSYWRWSCINEGILARFSDGAMANKQIDLEAIRAQIRSQLAAAMSLLRGRSTVVGLLRDSTTWT